MNNQPFTFPPPPPPPSQAAPYYPPPQDRPQDGYNDRSGRGGSGYRGRGRGNNRGGPRGGYAGNLGHASGYGGYPQTDQRREPFPNGQANNYGGGSYPLPDYPQVQQPQYPPSVYNAYNQPPPQYPPQPYPSTQYQPGPSYPIHGQPHDPSYPSHRQPHEPSYSSYGRPHDPSYSSHGQPHAPPHHSQPQNRPYDHAPPNHHVQHRPQRHTRQPVLMGPPIHIGPDGRPTDHRTSPYNPADVREVNRLPLGNHSPRPTGSTRHDSPNSFSSGPNPFSGARGKKRNRTEAFRQPNTMSARPQAAPAVPSFGNPLPVDLPTKPPGSAPNSKKKKKKKRRHNQLGLTPKADEHESSEEEEDDQDEEAKLAATANGQLQFTFKGHTSTLQSSSDIAQWIAERKKKFPTQAKAAEATERKKKNDEEQRAARQAAKESQEKRRAEAQAKREKQNAESLETQQQSEPKSADKPASSAKDAKAAKAQEKLEKLRRRLEKGEKKVAKAQAKASKGATDPQGSAHQPAPPAQAPTQAGESVQEGPEVTNGAHVDNGIESSTAKSNREAEGQINDKATSIQQTVTTADDAPLVSATHGTATVETAMPPNPLTPTSQPSNADQDQAESLKEILLDEAGLSIEPDPSAPNNMAPIEGADTEIDSDASSSISSSDLSSSEDDEDTSSSGESSSSDEAPETSTSKRTAPDRVPPPPREKTNKDICRDFLRTGRCRHGKGCRFSHELPKRGQKSKAEKRAKASEPKERKGLYQRLVEQENEQDDQQILNTIVQLGDRGFLREPLSQTAETENPAS